MDQLIVVIVTSSSHIADRGVCNEKHITSVYYELTVRIHNFNMTGHNPLS